MQLLLRVRRCRRCKPFSVPGLMPAHPQLVGIPQGQSSAGHPDGGQASAACSQPACRAQVWDVVKAAVFSEGHGLSMLQFAAALRLVAAAQQGITLTDTAVATLLDPPASVLQFGCLTAPRLDYPSSSQPAPSPARQHLRCGLCSVQSLLLWHGSSSKSHTLQAA